MESKEEQLVFNIADFAEYPGPRYKNQGDDSGEEFYEQKLKPLFEEVLAKSKLNNKIFRLVINLDDTAGYASSFLDEAFGNLTYDFSQDVVVKHLTIVSKQEPDWIKVIMTETIPEWQQKKIKGTPRKPDLIT